MLGLVLIMEPSDVVIMKRLLDNAESEKYGFYRLFKQAYF